MKIHLHASVKLFQSFFSFHSRHFAGENLGTQQKLKFHLTHLSDHIFLILHM
jgi:hypothetical protein